MVFKGEVGYFIFCLGAFYLLQLQVECDFIWQQTLNFCFRYFSSVEELIVLDFPVFIFIFYHRPDFLIILSTANCRLVDG